MVPYRRVSMRQIQIVLLVVVFIADRSAALQEGESCTHQGEQGSCIAYSKCERGARITVCSYSAQEAIVCCPQSQQIGTTTVKKVQQKTTPFASTNRGVGSRKDLGMRKSVQKCNEYKQLTTDSVSISSLTLNPTLVKFEVPKCEMTVKLIVGGNVTKPGEFPHMAAIGWRQQNGEYSFDCGGTLISDKFVLTAGHCNALSDIGVGPSIVRLGEQDLQSEDDGAEPVDYDILRFVLHPEFRPNVAKYNDLALIELRTRVTYTNFIRPACLYDSAVLNDRTGIAIGFGLLESFGSKSNQLRKVMLNIYDNELCNKQYKANRFVKQGILNTQMCVGDLTSGKDTCQGDSGGPLQVTRDENQCIYYVIGVTSFGKACGYNVPAIYTKVFPYLSWIESVVWP